MSLLFRPLEMFWYETPPAENPPGETTVSGEQQTSGTTEPRVFSADDFDRFQQSVTERFDQIGTRVDAFGREIQEGFGWMRTNLVPLSLDDDAVPDSPSESQGDNPAETVIEVQDRQTVRNRKPRARLNLGNLFR